MRRLLVALLPALLLAACSEPVLVPEAGPNAPGYTRRSLPLPPSVELVSDSVKASLPDGGNIDAVVRSDETFEITGWALLGAKAPRGVLRLVVPASADASVQEVTSVPRPDVVNATGDKALIWAGFTVTLRGSLPEDAGICILSKSTQGEFRLAGSDAAVCPG